jgi:hypothetical protein
VPGNCPVSGVDSGLESQTLGRWPLETSKCWASLGTARKPKEASVSSGLPEVNTDEGCRSVESGSYSLAKVQEESPISKDSSSDPLT